MTAKLGHEGAAAAAAAAAAATSNTSLLGKKALKTLGAQSNDAGGGSYSDFARRMMGNMGWKEGEGLGKEKQGRSTFVRVKKKADDAGIGKEADERAKVVDHWHIGAFEDAISAFKHLDTDKKRKKRKRDKPPASEDVYQEMFARTGGVRMGMRARADQTGKWKRTLDDASVSTAETAPTISSLPTSEEAADGDDTSGEHKSSKKGNRKEAETSESDRKKSKKKRKKEKKSPAGS
jgi:Pin2-interacting protein X1